MKGGLKVGAIGLPGVLMQGIAHSAPAVAVLITLPFITEQAGLAAPLAYLAAFAIVLLLGVGVAELAVEMPSAGGFFTYVSRAVHPDAGFLTSWLFFLYTGIVPALSLAMLGYIVQTTGAELGVAVPWWAVLIAGAAVTGWLTWRGIEIGTAAMLLLGLSEMAVVVLLAVWGLVSPGEGGLNFSSFSLAAAPSGSGLYLGIVFSIFALTGWEGVVPLAEESLDARRTVPRALYGTILIMGAYLVFTSWGLMVGWGTAALDKLKGGNEMITFVLARRHWGAGWLVLPFALVNSMLAASVASSIVSTRMWYSMARTGALPPALAVLHDRWKTPTNAVLLQTAVTLVVGLGVGFLVGPNKEFHMLGVALTLALALIYSLGNLGVFLHFRRERPARFRIWKHAVCPAVSTVAVLLVAYKSIVPLPPPPLRWAPAIVVVWMALGIVVLVFRSRKRRTGYAITSLTTLP